MLRKIQLVKEGDILRLRSHPIHYSNHIFFTSHLFGKLTLRRLFALVFTAFFFRPRNVIHPMVLSTDAADAIIQVSDVSDVFFDDVWACPVLDRSLTLLLRASCLPSC